MYHFALWKTWILMNCSSKQKIKGPHWDELERETWSPQKAYPQCGVTQEGRISQDRHFSWKSEELVLPHGVSVPLGSAPKREAPRMPGLENQQGWPPGVPNWDSPLKGLVPRSSEKTAVWKAPRLYVREIHLLIWGKAWRSRRHLKYSWGTDMLADALVALST